MFWGSIIWTNSMLLRFSLIVFCYCLSVKSESPLAPALYVFGDSLLDSGNNNVLPTLAKANFRPYGSNFARGATGRFTNGRTVADFIAEYLGLPFSPPYLSFQRSGTTMGLNYASGTCGILLETGKYLGNCLSIAEQINLFQRTVERDLRMHYENDKNLSSYLSKSIFAISIGSNDYINNCLQPDIYDSSQRHTPQSFAKLLIDTLRQHLQNLYDLGARKVVVFEIGPIGCIPWITSRYKHDGQCVEEINGLAILFNNQLGPMLNNLTSTLNGSSFILGHVHWLGYDAVINHSKYAEFLGLPFSPPYMSFRGSLPLTGLNYASASCGILPETGDYIGICLSLDDQINLFNQTVERQLPRHYQTSKGLSDYLSKSIFVISIGSNDSTSTINFNLSFILRANITPLSHLPHFSLIGPLGCILSITRQYKHNGTCVEDINQLAILFNDKLAPMLQNLTVTLNGSVFSLGHAHWLGYDAIINPANYELTDTSNPCCTSWGNGTLGCIPGLPPCTDIDDHYFWDGFHLTETVYSVIGREEMF